MDNQDQRRIQTAGAFSSHSHPPFSFSPSRYFFLSMFHYFIGSLSGFCCVGDLL